jgi:hypothetical protein
MKKVYLVGAMLIAGLGAKAQIQTFQNITAVKELPMYSVAEDTDTLGLLEFGQQAVLYSDIEGSGYIFGTAVIVDELELLPGAPPIPVTQRTHEVAAGFLVNSGYSVKGAMMLFGAADNPSGQDRNLNVKVYSLAENAAFGSTTAQNPDAEGPATVLRTQSFPFSAIEIDDEVIASTIVEFDQPVFSPTDFAVAVDLAALYTGTVDTVALYVNQPSSANNPEYGWLRLNAAPQGFAAQNFWVNLNVFDISVQIAIFAIVEESVGIEEAGFINGVKLNTYPNPALTSDNVRIDYTLENNAKAVEVTIFDMNGRLVQRFEEGSRIAGVHTVNVPAGMLSSGSYIYAITADNSRIAKRMEVVR